MSMRDRRLDVTAITPGDVVVIDRQSYVVSDITREEQAILENVVTHELRVMDLDDLRFRSNR